MTGKHLVHRSSVTGKWVSAEYAAQHPDTTETETVGLMRKVVARLALTLRRR